MEFVKVKFENGVFIINFIKLVFEKVKGFRVVNIVVEED